MALRAIAFHEAISAAKLEEIFKADVNILFAGTTAGQCPTCKLRFAVFFPAKDDPRNQEWLARVNEMIGNDCKAGRHHGQYAFTTMP